MQKHVENLHCKRGIKLDFIKLYKYKYITSVVLVLNV